MIDPGSKKECLNLWSVTKSEVIIFSLYWGEVEVIFYLNIL